MKHYIYSCDNGYLFEFDSYEKALNWLAKVSWECHIFQEDGTHIATRGHHRTVVIPEEHRHRVDLEKLKCTSLRQA